MCCSIHVPGSSANLGPGFDALGVALDLWMRVDISRRDDASLRDAGSPDLLGGANLVIDTMHVAAERFSFELPGCDIRITSDIPVARGLGSSASAIVAGIQAACVLAGYPVTPAEVIDLGGALEGHADNIAASVLGGITVAVQTPDTYIADILAARVAWDVVLFIPDGHALTREARGLLPSGIPLPDAVFNLGHAALLAHAVHRGNAKLLREAMRDRLHQPYRATIFPHLEPCIESAQEAGAAGAALSGAGPSVLAFAQPEHVDAVGKAMLSAAAACAISGHWRHIAVPEHGAWVSGSGAAAGVSSTR